jgi:peptidoglycan hydrolase-like protein with peptidoglycan-binding domain
MMARYSRVLVLLLCASTLLKAYVSSSPIAHAAGTESDSPSAQTSSSDYIKSLQRELKRAGYDPGVMDGKMGPATRLALRRFQEAHGLAPTGDPDIPTLTKLLGKGLPQ